MKAYLRTRHARISMPIPFESVFLQNASAFKCAYVMLIMATYWVTEAMPLAITSLLPVALLPLFGKYVTGWQSS